MGCVDGVKLSHTGMTRRCRSTGDHLLLYREYRAEMECDRFSTVSLKDAVGLLWYVFGEIHNVKSMIGFLSFMRNPRCLWLHKQCAPGTCTVRARSDGTRLLLLFSKSRYAGVVNAWSQPHEKRLIPCVVYLSSLLRIYRFKQAAWLTFNFLVFVFHKQIQVAGALNLIANAKAFRDRELAQAAAAAAAVRPAATSMVAVVAAAAATGVAAAMAAEAPNLAFAPSAAVPPAPTSTPAQSSAMSAVPGAALATPGAVAAGEGGAGEAAVKVAGMVVAGGVVGEGAAGAAAAAAVAAAAVGGGVVVGVTSTDSSIEDGRGGEGAAVAAAAGGNGVVVPAADPAVEVGW